MSARFVTRNLVLVCCSALLAVPAVAQDRRAVLIPKPDPQAAARYQLAVMEGALVAAVQLGAQTMTRQMQASMPQVLLMSGSARARGFRLDGYGVFFDVDVPAMRQSVVWTWRVLDRSGGPAAGAVDSLKNYAKTVSDPAEKRDVELMIRRLEAQVSASSTGPDGVRPAGQPATAAAMPGSTRPAATSLSAASAPRIADPPDDPNEVYTSTVKEAIIDAMLGHSAALRIGADEWLTIAARDAGDQRLSVDDAGDTVTILLRIKGSDLAALQAGRLTADEARKRVEVREY